MVDQGTWRGAMVVLSERGRRLIWLLRIGSIHLLALYWVACPATGQQAATADDVKKGHDLAILICANCHVAARDQPFAPILQPPAPSFESIAQRNATSGESVESFVTTTHKGLDNPKGMPNPQLLDHQVKQIAAYLLSLRNKP